MSQETQEGDGDFLTYGRLVPAGRVGSKVFARTLRIGEPDTGEGVKIEAGDELVIAAGDLVIDSRQIDGHSPKGLGEYAQVANTVWTWYRIVSVEMAFFNHLYPLARRLDTAHALWASSVQEREQAKEEGGISGRAKAISALGSAEIAFIALHRAMKMLHSLVTEYTLQVPGNVQKLWKTVEEMRHAFEHIDDRAKGKSGQSGKIDPGAVTIFYQPDFLESSIIHYKGYSLNFDKEFLSTLLECRELIMAVIDAQASAGATDNDTAVESSSPAVLQQ